MIGFGSFDNSTCKRVLDLLEPGDLKLGQVVIESCSSRAWSEQWKWRWWKPFWYRGMDGYSKADGYGNSKIWRQMDLVRKSEVFIKYEAEVSSRVGGGERGVVDFGKLFTETKMSRNAAFMLAFRRQYHSVVCTICVLLQRCLYACVFSRN